MRTLIHAAFLAGLLVPVAGIAQSAMAADLDYGYEPRPVPVLPPPPPPCGVYRPCFRPYPRLGYLVPRPYRFGDLRAYPRFGYGYGGPREHVEPYGRDHYGYEQRGYAPREHIERYGEGRPYADPRDLREGRDGYEHRERLDRYGDDERRREDERFGRGGPDRDLRGDDRG